MRPGCTKKVLPCYHQGSPRLALQAAYNGVAQNFAAMPGASAGYSPAAYAQAGMPYGQGVSNLPSGQKRDSTYDQASLQASV